MYVLQWARPRARFDEWACAFAAEGGHLELLREHGCPCNEVTFGYAAEGGHMDVLRWLREHDCRLNWSTCAFAAQGGQLKVLQWAREHERSWDAHAPLRAGTWRLSM